MMIFNLAFGLKIGPRFVLILSIDVYMDGSPCSNKSPRFYRAPLWYTLEHFDLELVQISSIDTADISYLQTLQ